MPDTHYYHILRFTDVIAYFGDFVLILNVPSVGLAPTYQPNLTSIICMGVDTFVQGTVVQGPLCPRDISPRRLLSKETLVQ